MARADGGMALWARVADDIDVDGWAEAAERDNILFRGARMYDFRGRPIPFVRLGFTFHAERELEEAVQRMARALRRLRAMTSYTCSGSKAGDAMISSCEFRIATCEGQPLLV